MKQSVCATTLGLLTLLILLAIFVPDTNARPHRAPHRQKRVSDQRLAELETLLALAKMRGKLVTVPIGFGRIDHTKIGRRRRRSLLKKSLLPHEQLEQERNFLLGLDDDYETDKKSIAPSSDQEIDNESSSGDFEEQRSGSSAQYEDLLRQYLLAWARDTNYQD